MYCNSIKLAQAGRNDLQEAQRTQSIQLRSTEPGFRFKEACLLCGTAVSFSSRKATGETCRATTKSIMHILLEHCSTRREDWADEVRARLLAVHDLPGADAVYHQKCSTNFRTGKRVPLMFMQNEDGAPQKRHKVGRPMKSNETGRGANKEQADAFMKVEIFFKESDDEQTTVLDLVEKMAEYLIESDIEPFSHIYMKSKLLEHFKDQS